MKQKKLLIVVGTRPNFIKVTCFKDVAEKHPGLEVEIVHTGQHFDEKMAGVFFSQLNLQPDHFISLNGQSAVSQMGEIMIEMEKLLQEIRPNLLMVVGDVNSTLAAAIVANKMNIKLLHLESGLRSFDDEMPEEWNRVLTDRLSKSLFVTEQSGVNNLLQEGKKAEDIYLVGNTMIDSLVKYSKTIEQSRILKELGLDTKKFILMTIHRPATVDTKEGLEMLLTVLQSFPEEFTTVFPIHPRTKKQIHAFGLSEAFFKLHNVKWVDPLDYFSFQKLISSCFVVITDSGGIQEEATYRQVPCLTLRKNTERPSTIELGTNTLVPFHDKTIREWLDSIAGGTYKKGTIPPLWDGKATERILSIIAQKC
ncbi:MAG TPA: UDP-N-acetylglucosamine 2-epimerase (non-hydrolyzing) [Ferruginibacter sp.]|nr:UDP-N-acetylglucosamine 2-epimerase (non-hydrolyzing) [Ferruginibacter sp.]HRO16573.1 UDP-N-acetylglucosamine 2-epimerase (non-hydrolyzing) [Ferruginibacter sp.]HRQ19918.1 UDP-N-acetylglucosamine 2-epimerase (non-hydrolyzing) [Ferruginibacter sp.]